MNFFLPGVTDAADAEALHAHIRQNATAQWSGRTLDSRRFEAIGFTHNGKTIVNEVGKMDPDQREPVLAIIKLLDGPYLVVTASRGFRTADAMIVGEDSVVSAVEFEP